MEFENKRHTMLINKRFHYRLIGRFLFANVIIMGMFGGVLYLFLDNEIQSNLYSAHVVYKNMKSMLIPIVLTLTTLNIIISSIVISLIVLFMSQKIVGPLHRFRCAIQEICQKNLGPSLDLRDNDELFPLSDQLKEMIENLQQDGGKIKKVQLRLKELNQELQNSELETEIEKLGSVSRQYRF